MRKNKIDLHNAATLWINEWMKNEWSKISLNCELNFLIKIKIIFWFATVKRDQHREHRKKFVFLTSTDASAELFSQIN